MKKLIDIATDPEQYSHGNASTWIGDDDRQKKQQDNFGNAIKPFIKLTCSSILDIGCGMGWSSYKFSNKEISWLGLEPSSSHFNTAKKLHPELNILNSTFEAYSTTATFDLVIAIMVFSHIRDVKSAFEKIYSLLNKDGVFAMVCSTFHDEVNRLERNGRKYQVEIIDEDQYVDKAIVGAYGIADINRRSEYYIKIADKCGLTLTNHSKILDTGYSPKELLVFTREQ